MAVATLKAAMPRLTIAALACLSLLLGSCGGGVGSGGTGGGATASSASGPITGFGSVIVTGIRFDESTARIEDEDGLLSTRDHLMLGMTTEIEASGVTASASGPVATASVVRFASEIVGPVNAVSASTASFTALGQMVRVTPATVFDAAFAGGLAALVPGNVVEVFGQFDVVTQTYVATRVQPKAGAWSYKLRGIVGAFDATAKTLTVGGQVFSYASNPPADPASAFAVGKIVRLKVHTTKSNGVWVLTASSSGAIRLGEGGGAEVDGRITAFTSVRQFSVDGVPVDASNATFPGGTGGIVLGARIEVEGTVSAGILVATTVKIESDEAEGAEPFELHGTISAADATAKTFVVRGVSVTWTSATVFSSSSAADLVNGRSVEVKGALSADRTRLVASKIEVAH